MNAFIRTARSALSCALAAFGFAAFSLHASAASAAPTFTDPTVRELSLDACLDAALQNNRRRPASRFAVAAAEAQHRQALSGYWPQLQLTAAALRTDEAPDFIVPAMTIGVPAQTIVTPASTAVVTVPAGVLGPTAIQLPVGVPSQSISTPAQAFQIPEQRIQVMDPSSAAGSVSLTWLLYDGGLRRGYRTQAEGLVEAMKQEARRTDLEIADSVKRMYYGAVLARAIHRLGLDTLERMQATLDLTESMYQGGGGKVQKTDFLDNKVIVSTLRSLVSLLAKNEAMSQAALANTMGLPWHASIAPQATEIPFDPLASELPALVGDAYQFSPDWKRLEAGLHAAEGAVQTARSGHAPKIALTGELHRWWNSYDAGAATDVNKQGWTAGVALELPLFDGFLTRQKVAAARARLAELKEQKILLQEGLGLQIKDAFLGLAAARDAYQATLDAMNAAEENRDLNVRAYQNELVETDKVIRAQLTEAFMTAQHLKIRYDHFALQSQLALIVGSEIERRLAPSR